MDEPTVMTVDGDERVILRVRNENVVSIVFDTVSVDIECVNGKLYTSVEQYDHYDTEEEDVDSSTADESVTLGSEDTDIRDLPHFIGDVNEFAGGTFEELNEEHEWQTQCHMNAIEEAEANVYSDSA